MGIAKARLGSVTSHLGVASVLMLSSAAAIAQIPGAEPPRQVAPTREEIEQPTTPAERPKSQVTIDSSKALAEESCSLASSPLRIALTRIEFKAPGGAEVNPVLRPSLEALKPDESGDQSISVICRIRDRVNGALERAGYVARVQIPPQDLQDGTLQLTIVAGHIVDMRVRGSVGRFDALLSKRLAKIAAMDPFNKNEAVRMLLLANDIPGLRVRLALSNANQEPGALIGEVQADAQSVQVFAKAQNFGSQELGREIGTVRAEVYGLTGLADRTYFSLSNSFQWKETHIGQIGHDMALNDNGLRVGTERQPRPVGAGHPQAGPADQVADRRLRTEHAPAQKAGQVDQRGRRLRDTQSGHAHHQCRAESAVHA